MIEMWIPSRLASRVPSVGQVRTGHIQAGPWTFADYVNEDLCVEQLSDVIAGANAPVPHDHRRLGNVVAVVRQKAAHGRQQRSQLFVDCVRVQSVRHDNLDAAAPASR
jgi:hypothetical protein